MPDITLEPGSPSERIALHLVKFPGVELARSDVARLLGVAPAAVDNCLQPGTGLGLITCFNNADLGGRCWRAGPRLANWRQPQADNTPAQQPASPPTPGTASAPASKSKRGGKMQRLPPLQLSLLKVARDVPLPPATGMCAKGRTKYDAHLDMLDSDGACLMGIAAIYKGALKKAIETYLQGHPDVAAKSILVVRQVDEASIGVWRVAKGTPGTEKARRQPTLKAA